MRATYVLALEVDDGVERLAAELLGQEVLEAVLRFERLAVEREGEAAVEEGVVPEHVLDELHAILEVLAEELLVGGEGDDGAVALLGLGDAVVLHELAAGELDELGLAVADGLGHVFDGEGVDGLLADAVEADGFLEGLAVVFGAGVDDRDAVDELAQRDAAAVIAHPDGAAGDLDLDLPAGAHREFVDGVVDGLLEEDVDAVLGMGAVAEAADIHAGADPDVLEGAEGLDAGFGVVASHGGWANTEAVALRLASAFAPLRRSCCPLLRARDQSRGPAPRLNSPPGSGSRCALLGTRDLSSVLAARNRGKQNTGKEPSGK